MFSFTQYLERGGSEPKSLLKQRLFRQRLKHRQVIPRFNQRRVRPKFNKRLLRQGPFRLSLSRPLSCPKGRGRGSLAVHKLV